MKHGMKHSHSPRHINAVNQVAAYATAYRGGCWYWYWCGKMSPLEFFERMFELKFKADKFDILNKLATIVSRETLSFIRGDIRHKFVATPITTLILIFIILFTI
jgi:hypothetical protein